MKRLENSGLPKFLNGEALKEAKTITGSQSKAFGGPI
jgi:hypothetical protein